MLVEPVNLTDPELAVLRQAAALIRRGGIVVYPTDTAYALGGRYDTASVIRRVLKIKGRNDRTFTLIAATVRQVQKHFYLSSAQLKLARKYWPGPLSLVVSTRFAVRVPASTLARTLARRVGVPLIATSANRTGGRTPYTAAAVIRQLAGRSQPDLLLDAGKLHHQKTSTVVAVDARGNMAVLRPGAVKL